MTIALVENDRLKAHVTKQLTVYSWDSYNIFDLTNMYNWE